MVFFLQAAGFQVFTIAADIFTASPIDCRQWGGDVGNRLCADNFRTGAGKFFTKNDGPGIVFHETALSHMYAIGTKT